MATQYTDKLGLALPVQGELTGSWGNVINEQITSLLETAVAGIATINTWTTNSHTLTVADGAPAESRAAILSLTDTGVALSGAGTVVCPAESKIYFVRNSTAQAITIKPSAGTGIVVQSGFTGIVFCDGVNVVDAINPIFFDNTTSGLSATNLQSALDELDGLVNTNTSNIATNTSNIATNTSNIATNTSDLTTHVDDVTNPHAVTKSQVGLSNVDNTSDANKPVSTSQQTALDLKADRSSLNRQSLLDNPLCHLFKTNKLVDTSAPTSTDSDITFTRASTATYVDRYGIVKTAAVDTIREEKDGFLIEEAGTNLVPYSEQFDNAAWAKTGSTVITPNATTSPDGTVTADKIDFTITSDRLFKVVVNTTAASSTFSMWVKSPSADRSIRLQLRNTPTSANNSINDVTVTSEWQRFSVTLASLAENLVCEVVSIAVDLDFYIWGAQIEQSPVATSYIPTVATPVTRIADKALLPVLNNVVTKEFSIFGIISNLSSGTTAGNRFIFRMPVASGFFALFYNANFANRFFFRYDDDSAGVQPAVISTDNIKYFVVTVDETNVKLNINGTEVSTTKLSDPSLVLADDFPFFASTVSVGAQFNGNIKDFRIYDFALNANEIEYLLP